MPSSEPGGPAPQDPSPSRRTCSNQVQPGHLLLPLTKASLTGPSPPPAKLGRAQGAPSPKGPLEIGWSPDAQPLRLGETFLPKGVAQLSRASSSGHKVGLLQPCPPHPLLPPGESSPSPEAVLSESWTRLWVSERKAWWLAGHRKWWASGESIYTWGAASPSTRGNVAFPEEGLTERCSHGSRNHSV